VTSEGAAARIGAILETLGRDLDALKEAGRGVPAVERNVVRMRGTLRALQVQFADLDPRSKPEG